MILDYERALCGIERLLKLELIMCSSCALQDRRRRRAGPRELRLDLCDLAVAVSVSRHGPEAEGEENTSREHGVQSCCTCIRK